MKDSITTIKGVLIDQIRDLYSAETQIAKALPLFAAKATSPDLKDGFTLHLQETLEHIERLKTISNLLGVKPSGKKCEAAAGLVKEGDETLEEKATAPIKDVMIIGAARRVEHYEIAAYTGACDLARALGLSEVLKMLALTLGEEVAADGLLAKLSVPTLATASASEE